MNLTPRLLLKKLLVLPDAHHLELIQPLAGTLEFVLLCFLGIAIVSTALALVHQQSNPALSRRFALAITPKLSAWITFGVLPIMTLTVLLGQLVYGSQFGIFPAIVKISPLAGLGLLALWRYRQCDCRIAGTIGVLATLGFALPFVNLLEMLHWPERWPVLNPLVPNIYDVQGIVRALIFLASAVLATGAALLFRGFVWSESRIVDDAPERALARIWALILTAVGAVLLPALVVWDSAILPVGAQSVHALAMGAPLVIALWLAALLALAMLCDSTKLCGATLVVLLAFTGLACETMRENFIQSTALADKLALVRMQAEEQFAKLQMEQESHYTSNVPLDPKAGERIYAEKCSACHAFDHKVVGPAHKDVLPKYVGQIDKLQGFILAPQKMDAAFPAMPAQGLSRREARAVADYLLLRLAAETKGGAQ